MGRDALWSRLETPGQVIDKCKVMRAAEVLPGEQGFLVPHQAATQGSHTEKMSPQNVWL